MVSKYLHLISLTTNQISSEVLLDNGHQGATVFQMQTSDHYVVFFSFFYTAYIAAKSDS